MDNRSKEFLKELESEEKATKKCLERVPENLFKWKPHDRSMTMGNLALLIADIPKWIQQIVENDYIDFATYEHFEAKTTKELVEHFDKNMEFAKRALSNASDESLNEIFSLKDHGKVLTSSPRSSEIMSAINHLVHHRGQLTVYLRLNNILVPSIYGPSADEGT